MPQINHIPDVEQKKFQLETEAETKRNEETVSSVVALQSQFGDQND